MTYWKTTLLLLVVTVGVGAYVSLYELKQPSPEQRERLAQRVLAVEPDTVSALTLDMPEGTATLSRTGTRWTIGPQQARADGALVQRLLEALDPLMAERVLAGSKEQPLDPKSFGLDPPVGTITLTTDGAPLSVFFGEPTAVHDNRYLKVTGRPETFVVSAALFDDANQPEEHFRDRTLVRLEPDLLDALTISSASSTFTVTRDQKTWRLTEPVQDLADRSKVQAMLNALDPLAIAKFLEGDPQDIPKPEWGFEAPHATITLTHRSEPDPSPLTLTVGAPLAEPPPPGGAPPTAGAASQRYARRSDEPFLYAVEASKLDAFLADPAGLRATQCVEFFTSLVTRIEVTRDGAAWTLAKSDGQWRQGGSDQALETTRVEDWLGKLADLRVVGFVEDQPADLARYGLEPAAGTIAISTSDREGPQRLLVGAPVEGSTDRSGRIEGRAAVVRLPGAVTELLATTPTDLAPAPQPVTSGPSTDQPEGALHPLQHGGVGEDGQQQ